MDIDEANKQTSRRDPTSIIRQVKADPDPNSHFTLSSVSMYTQEPVEQVMVSRAKACAKMYKQAYTKTDTVIVRTDMGFRVSDS